MIGSKITLLAASGLLVASMGVAGAQGTGSSSDALANKDKCWDVASKEIKDKSASASGSASTSAGTTGSAMSKPDSGSASGSVSAGASGSASGSASADRPAAAAGLPEC